MFVIFIIMHICK